MNTSDSITVFWYFKNGDVRNANSNIEWVKYRDIEMQIIEEAYQQGKPEVLLDKYRIDLKECIQFNRTNSSKQRPVRRQIGCKIQECLREERFNSPLLRTSTPSYGNALAWCPFLTEWLKSSAGKKAVLDFPSAIDACIDGILQEAVKSQSDSVTEAQWMVEQLRSCKMKPRRETSNVCIHLYTRESFLYRVLNTVLRDADHSKLATLGPLCFLIRDYSRTCIDYIGTVYRGVDFSLTTIFSYKKAVGSWRTWPSYTSTSKNRKMAEFRGNTLFIIEITNVKLSSPRAYDVAEISQFPSEEEVLLPAGVSFQVISVEPDLKQKYIIQIKL
ncbi:unnamed protein product [Rotaria socialis]|uniref:NAD(P)(+)--arginine ADP-ribosyltransferase n=3 Tax=Rotaria TaxID=231623 RepID=A0A817S2C0_9BILA|nr:unnamed protein product [Rotaria socialis]CAF3647692.1 unnamed protein product [Rotaria socialis]CAF3780488.1 unnamed protein product [Rotaria socialis]CAF4217352.1 unnamed protein product [Rotaria socialis]CAF4322325.1 unnamed protein product [Rotaria socialis]